MLKEEFEELIKREVNENQYKNIETAYEALPEYIVFLLIYFIHQIKFWVLACRFVRIGMPISVS